MQETTNLKLRKPEYNEYADIADINHNMDILDEEVNKKANNTHEHDVSDIKDFEKEVKNVKVNNADKLDDLDSTDFMRSFMGNGALANDLGVAQYMRWSNYGQNHIIFDASKSIRPNGTACDRINSEQPWTAANCPTLMGFNGHQTWGVRVDNARTADQVQGFQFRNNNGMLEVLINGVWMSVGGQTYNNLKQFNFNTFTTTTNNGTTHYSPLVREGEVRTLVDIQRPCKLVALNTTSGIVYTGGNTINPACRGIRELRIYIDDILKFTAQVLQFNGTGNAQGQYLINGDSYVGAYSGSAYYTDSYLKNLEARKRFKIDALIGTGINKDGSTYNNGGTPTISTFFAQFLVND